MPEPVWTQTYKVDFCALHGEFSRGYLAVIDIETSVLTSKGEIVEDWYIVLERLRTRYSFQQLERVLEAPPTLPNVCTDVAEVVARSIKPNSKVTRVCVSERYESDPLMSDQCTLTWR